MEGFTQTTFQHQDRQWPVFRAGSGPGVLVIHEIPGITPQVAAFAQRVAQAGFSVMLPSLFGTPGKPFSNGYMAAQVVHACISKEFHVLARHHASPITEALRAMARALYQETGTAVGAVGMCLTGNFALTLMIDPFLMAPVLSQPSLPFGLSASHRAALHISPEHLDIAKARGCPVLGLRFSHDMACPKARFDALRTALGERFEAIEIDSSPGNPHGIPRMAHSVLTKDLVDQDGHPTQAALQRVIGFLHERLHGGQDTHA